MSEWASATRKVSAGGLTPCHQEVPLGMRQLHEGIDRVHAEVHIVSRAEE